MQVVGTNNQIIDSLHIRDLAIRTWDPKRPQSMQKVTDAIMDFFGYRVGDYLYDGSPYHFTGYVVDGLRKDIEATNDMERVRTLQRRIQSVKAYGDIFWDVRFGAKNARLLSLKDVLSIIDILNRFYAFFAPWHISLCNSTHATIINVNYSRRKQYGKKL